MSLRKVNKNLKEHEVALNMTSMIDLTFLLVFFFVLTSAFTSLNLEDVLLPVALSAQEIKPAEDVAILIINIKKMNDQTRAGEIHFNGQTHNLNSLIEALRLEVLSDAERRGMEPGGPGLPPLSKLEVLVRADEGVTGRYLREVFLACQKAGIYKVKLAALQE
ncbi:MAG: biopolymer transporter ExbD [Planctomycetes bacterium]|nr:biopolymer transporter ExbD [Planctomycetota bacterium]